MRLNDAHVVPSVAAGKVTGKAEPLSLRFSCYLIL